MASIFYCPSCSKFHFNELKGDEFLVSCPHCYKRTGVDTGILKETYDSMSDVDKNNLKQEIKTKYTKVYVDDLVQRLIKEKTGREYEITMAGGTITAYQDRVEIVKKGLFGKVSSTKVIPVSSLVSVSVKPTKFGSIGFIEFTTPGSRDSRNCQEAMENENAMVIEVGHNDEAMKMKECVDKLILEYQNKKNQSAGTTIVQQAVSPAEELKKMKELLDLGIITQEEFDAKKKQLLGL